MAGRQWMWRWLVRGDASLDDAVLRRRGAWLSVTLLSVVPLYLAMALSARATVPAIANASVAAGLLVGVGLTVWAYRLGALRLASWGLAVLTVVAAGAVGLVEVDALRASMALLAGALGVLYASFLVPPRGVAALALAYVIVVAGTALVHPVVPAAQLVVPTFAAALFAVMGVAGAYFRASSDQASLARKRGGRLQVPLANVVTHLQYFERQLRASLPLTSAEELSDLFDKLSADGQSLMGVAEEWLALADCGEDLHVDPVEVDEALDSIHAGVAAAAQDRNIQLVRVRGGPECRVAGVESLLSHAWLHLVLHGLYALEKTHRRLEIRTERTPDNQVRVTVGPEWATDGQPVPKAQHASLCLCEAIVEGLGGRYRLLRVQGGLVYEATFPAPS